MTRLLKKKAILSGSQVPSIFRFFKNGGNGISSLLKSSEKLLASLESIQVNLLFALGPVPLPITPPKKPLFY